MPLPSTGGALAKAGVPKIIRFALHGHSNRPFFHIVVANGKDKRDELPIEQIGTYDPMPNTDNQKLLALNVERARYWMGQGAIFSTPVAKLLGYVGFLPTHPRTIVDAWKNREVEVEQRQQAAKQEQENTSSGPSQPPSSAV